MKRLPTLLKLCAALALLLLLAGGSLLVFLQSGWIAHRLQQAIVSGVEDATGARVEIPSFEWNWQTLTVEIRGFTLHGFEPPSGPSLFYSPLIRARLRILSLLDQNVQLASLVVTRPRFYLIVEANGKTNIPGPRHIISPREIINTLVNIRLPHVEATDGWARINARSIPVSLVGDHVSLLIQFRRGERRYKIELQSPALQLAGNRTTYFAGAVNAGAYLWRDHLSITPSRFHSQSADVTLSGSLYEFNNPVIDWHLASTFATTAALQSFGIPGIDGGVITLNGIGHHDPQTPLFFDGQLAADHLSLRRSGLRLQEGRLSSRLTLDNSNLKLAELSLSSSEGRFTGSATLTAFRNLQLSGVVSALSLDFVASAVVHKPLPWSATLSGPFEMTAVVQPALHDLVLQGALTLQPQSPGIPVSGDIHYRYRQKDGEFTVDQSHLQLPHTQVALDVQPGARVAFQLDTTDWNDLNPGLSLLGIDRAAIKGTDLKGTDLDLPALAPGGSAHLRGTAQLGNATSIHAEGTLDVARLQWKGALVDRLRSQFKVSPTSLLLSPLTLDSALLQTTASLQIPLTGWRPDLSSPGQASGSFSGVKVQSLLALAKISPPIPLAGGSAAGSFHLNGTASNPAGDAQIRLTDWTVHGEHLDSAQATLTLANHRLSVSHGQLQSGSAVLSFAGAYAYAERNLKQGELQLALDTSRFPLPRLYPLVPVFHTLDGQIDLHVRTALTISPSGVSPVNLSGTASLHRLLYKGVLIGDLDTSASTAGAVIKTELKANVRGSQISGSGAIQLAPGAPASGRLTFAPISLRTIAAILQPESSLPTLSASAQGSLVFDGPLQSPARLHAILQLLDLQITGPPIPTLGGDLAHPSALAKPADELLLQSTAPVTVEYSNGVAAIRSADFRGRDSRLTVSGTAGLLGAQPAHLVLNGGVDLRLLQLLYPDLQIGGQSKIDAAISGTLADPQLAGSVQLIDGSVASPLVPNSLSNLSGTVRFDQHRATLENVTAHTGGGLVRFGGFVTYTVHQPLVYRLDSSGQNIRVRYANGISITGNSQFSLTGTSEQSLLSGGITVSRVVLNPSADLGNLLALTAAPAVASDNSRDYLSRLQMDIHVESAPNLQFDTALSSNVQTELDLQLRGTPKQPVILGSIEANQGDIKVFGSRYTINRAQVTFANAARLEPVLDLDLQTQARGITVDITVSGTLNKLNINYRSDPPLQPRDIIALLTIGRTPQTTSGDANVSATNDASSLQAGANSVLGQAIAPVSNRLSKLFGITNIKIDPLVQGITNTPQARLTLEQQISRQITVTYITNLSQTSEQIFRLEYSLNPQFSLVALRDDNGEFGIDILYKKRFK